MTTHDPIEGGWFVLSTTLFESPVFRGPPDILRLWLLLLGSAHRNSKPFRLWNGKEIGRGELVTSLAELSKQLSRSGNAQFKEPSRVILSSKTISRWLDMMQDRGMILCSRTRNEGTWIRIVNFEHYQTLDNYRGSIKRTAKMNEGSYRAHSQAHTVEQGCLPLVSHNCIAGNCDERTGECQTSVKRASIDNDGSIYIRKVSAELEGSKNLSKVAPNGSRSEPSPLIFDYGSLKWNRKTTDEERAEWREAFPGINLKQQFYQATLWLKENKDKKRKKNFKKFLRNWFSNEQSKVDARTR